MNSRLIPEAEAFFFPKNTPPPVEITTLILDFLVSACTAEEARITLCSCLALSRSFWISAREKLFRVLNIDQKFGRDAVQRLTVLLALVKPHDTLSVVPCIKELSIKFGPDMFESVLDDRNGTLADILTNLTSPRSQITQFNFHCESAPGLNWVNISTYLNRAIRQFIKLGTLERLSITNVYNLPVPFFHGGHFRDLRLAGTSYRPSQMVPMLTDSGDFVMRDPEAGSGAPPSIHTLSTNNDSFLACFARPNEAPLAPMRTFKLTIFATSCTENLGLVFQQAYQSLETCKLKLRPQSSWISKLPNFDALHQLKKIELLIPIDMRSNGDDPLIAVAPLLNISAPMTSQVHMTVVFESYRELNIHLLDQNDRWSPIDMHLADPMKFGAARAKKIVIQGLGWDTSAVLEAQAWLQQNGLQRCFALRPSPYVMSL